MPRERVFVMQPCSRHSEHHQRASSDRYVFPEVDVIVHAIGRRISPVRMEQHAGGNGEDCDHQSRPAGLPPEEHEKPRAELDRDRNRITE
jgi:hypothetical protein